MAAYAIDPLGDVRWPEFLQRDPRASVFHSRGWLEALRQTYGYEPVVYTTSDPSSNLSNGWAFCRIRSWLTGKRCVSLPFSDHCNPLMDSSESLSEVISRLRHERENNDWKYIELRPTVSELSLEGFESSKTFFLHRLDLQHDRAEIFANLHKSSTQRKIKRAEREGLTLECGSSERLLSQFYKLLVLTRRRHYLPPQPRAWFSNLVSFMDKQLNIWVASKQGIPVASILTLNFKRTLVYKYGCGDPGFFNLGGMQLLLWRAIERAKEQGFTDVDLGRSDQDDNGLILFKDRLGASRWPISYFRNPSVTPRSSPPLRSSRMEKTVFSHLPVPLLVAGGRFLHKHFG